MTIARPQTDYVLSLSLRAGLTENQNCTSPCTSRHSHPSHPTSMATPTHRVRSERLSPGHSLGNKSAEHESSNTLNIHAMPQTVAALAALALAALRPSRESPPKVLQKPSKKSSKSAPRVLQKCSKGPPKVLEGPSKNPRRVL